MLLDAEPLIRRFPQEERLYRLRCVEGWSMAVPWSGFALKALVEYAKKNGIVFTYMGQRSTPPAFLTASVSRPRQASTASIALIAEPRITGALSPS